MKLCLKYQNIFLQYFRYFIVWVHSPKNILKNCFFEVLIGVFTLFRCRKQGGCHILILHVDPLFPLFSNVT